MEAKNIQKKLVIDRVNALMRQAQKDTEEIMTAHQDEGTDTMGKALLIYLAMAQDSLATVKKFSSMVFGMDITKNESITDEVLDSIFKEMDSEEEM